MKRILSSANFHKTRQRGFTLLELLVSLLLCGIISAIVVNALIFQSTTYVTDLFRVRIQENLRGALDIISMNIRQAGEGLNAYFPAVTLDSGNVLTLRRKIVEQVLTVCKPIAIGDSRIFVSDNTSSNTQCIPANIAPSLTDWTTYRTAQTGQVVAIYVYNLVTKTGEFINYSNQGTSSNSDYLLVTPLVHAYPILSTSVYVIEQYTFNLDNSSQTLVLTINGDPSAPQDVAYNVTQFGATITMQDGSVVTSLASTDVKNWANIREVNVGLTGQQSWKSKMITRSVSGKYFPRNVLSQ